MSSVRTAARDWLAAGGSDVEKLKKGLAVLTEGRSRGGRRSCDRIGCERQFTSFEHAKQSGLSSKCMGGTRRNAAIGTSFGLCVVVRLLSRYVSDQHPCRVCDDVCERTLARLDDVAALLRTDTEAFACLDAERRAVHRISLAVTMARYYMDEADSGYAAASKWLRAEMVARFAEAAAWPSKREVSALSQPMLCEWITSSEFQSSFSSPPAYVLRRVPPLQGLLCHHSPADFCKSSVSEDTESSFESLLSEASTLSASLDVSSMSL